MLQYLDYVAKHMGAGFSPKRNYESFRETINVASEAATNRKRLEIRYRAVSTGRTTLRKLDPYQIWAMNGVLYLIGHCHVRNAVRTFVLDRIKNIQLLSESFEYPEEFDLDIGQWQIRLSTPIDLCLATPSLDMPVLFLPVLSLWTFMVTLSDWQAAARETLRSEKSHIHDVLARSSTILPGKSDRVRQRVSGPRDR